jgi:hypothetical protein
LILAIKKQAHKAKPTKLISPAAATTMGFADLDFATIHNVIDSWERLRQKKDFDVEAGTLLFAK